MTKVQNTHCQDERYGGQRTGGHNQPYIEKEVPMPQEKKEEEEERGIISQYAGGFTDRMVEIKGVAI